jgi:hypothetical protein
VQKCRRQLPTGVRPTACAPLLPFHASLVNSTFLAFVMQAIPLAPSIARITVGACPYPYHSRSSPMATCRKDLARPSSWTISRHAPLFLSNEAESCFSTFAPSLVPVVAKCCCGPSYDGLQLCLSQFLRLACVHETYSIVIVQRRWRPEDV